MYERIKKTSSYRIVAFLSGFLFLSASLSVALQSPTHALSLNLGETVQAVTNNVPVVKNVAPLLIQSPTTPSTNTQPANNTTTRTETTPAQKPAPVQTPNTTPVASQPTQAEAVQTSAASSSMTTTRSIASTSTGSAQTLAANGLSVGAKETQIASAIPHATSPAVTYGTNALNGKTAGAIILGSLTAIAGGAYVLYAYRPSLFARR